MKHRVLAACTALAWATGLASSCASPTPGPRPALDPMSVRSPAQGEIVGFTGSYGSHAWLGIPYAQPPVGALRWRAPQPAQPWSGQRQALEHGAVCPQFPSAFGGVVSDDPTQPVGNEDCLTLSVYAPRRGPDELPKDGARWPVMFWIHGGGNTFGHAAFYDGGNVAQSEDVVVVMIQYRLGSLGWFRHASLRGAAANPEEASGNFGTLDMIHGLEWVRDNIAAFGGDPHNVTIFGESAGGRDVLSLLVAERARGLFHRAISQSGSVRTDSPAEAENWTDDAQPGSVASSNEVLAQLLLRDGKASDRAQAKSVANGWSAAQAATYLRSKSAADVLLAAREPSRESVLPVIPNVFSDGELLPASGVLSALASPARHAQVPVILGTNRDENRLFMLLDPRFVKVWFGAVYRMRDPEEFFPTAEALARMWKVDGADAPAAALVASKQPDVYVYRFDWDEEPTLLGADFSQLLGAAHGIEIAFVFGHEEVGPMRRALFTKDNEAGRKQLGRAMMAYWAEFARTGKPGRGREGRLPAWTAWDPAPGQPKMMIFDTPVVEPARQADATPSVASGTQPSKSGRSPGGEPSAGGTRMSSEFVTAEAAIAQIEADPRLSDIAKRCGVFRQLVQRKNMSPEAYAERCPTAR